ncbi:D-2-hydroxyacid dehydrogenase [Lentilactobacillus buchneri]|nr:D-2-hydroxyacid dehydrogenase [Lentilactobacillus sp. Egmn17]
MKKILAYNILGYEKEFVLEWAAEHPDVQVDFNDVELHDDTVDLAKGYDGIDYRQRSMLSETPDLYRKLCDFGITQLSLRSAGVDSCNLKWAKEYGLTISNVPSYSPEAVAEMTLTHALNLIRHIGSTVAKIFKRFGARVLGNDIHENDAFRDLVTYTSKEDIFKNADLITMHTYMSDENYHMIDKAQFTQMKPSAFFINCSRRGPIINTDALIDALQNHQIAGAGIDVIENETEIFNQSFDGDIPLKEYTKLKAMDNVFLTPHVAFYTDIAVKNMVKQSLDTN